MEPTREDFLKVIDMAEYATKQWQNAVEENKNLRTQVELLQIGMKMMKDNHDLQKRIMSLQR